MSGPVVAGENLGDALGLYNGAIGTHVHAGVENVATIDAMRSMYPGAMAPSASGEMTNAANPAQPEPTSVVQTADLNLTAKLANPTV